MKCFWGDKMKCFMKCFIDGDCLVVVKNNFINLQESTAVFIKITKSKREEIERDIKEEDMVEKLKKCRHRWRYNGTRVGGEFDGAETYDCRCGAVMFLDVLEPDNKEG